MTAPHDDPFAQPDKAPAVSFKDQPIGTVRHLDVSEPARSVQQRDFDTDEPAFWPDNTDGSKGKPKMAAVYNGLDENGEQCSLWCPIPSDLFAKMTVHEKAFRAKGAPIGGGPNVERIYVKLENRVPAKNPKFNKSIYATKVETVGPKPAQQAAESDPWASNGQAEPASGGGFSDEPPF